jgi:hypothetical protein
VVERTRKRGTRRITVLVTRSCKKFKKRGRKTVRKWLKSFKPKRRMNRSKGAKFIQSVFQKLKKG